MGRYHEHARNRLKASVISLAFKGTNGINNHNIEYGVSFNTEKIHDRSREWELRDSAGYSLPFDPSVLKVIYNLDSRHDINSTRFAFYAQDTYRLQTSAGYLNINGGVRLSYWSFNKEFLVSPRLSLGFVPRQDAAMGIQILYRSLLPISVLQGIPPACRGCRRQQYNTS